MKRYSLILLEGMRYVALAYEELLGQRIQSYRLAHICFYIGYQLAVKTVIGCVFMRMILLIYMTVHAEQKIAYKERYPETLSVMIQLCFLDEIKESGFQRIEGYGITVVNIDIFLLRQIENVAYILGYGTEVFIIVFADPEYDTLVNLIGIVGNRIMIYSGRNDNDIIRHESVRASVNVIIDIPLYEKIAFIVGMMMKLGRSEVRIAVVKQLVILRKHVLSIGKCGS